MRPTESASDEEDTTPLGSSMNPQGARSLQEWELRSLFFIFPLPLWKQNQWNYVLVKKAHIITWHRMAA